MSVVERIGVLARDVVKLRDNAELRLGDGAQGSDWAVSDVKLTWDGTDLDLVPTTDDTVFKIGTGTYSFDVWLYGQSSSYYWLWDASTSILHGSGGVTVNLQDSNYLKFGDGNDVNMYWDATRMVILPAVDDTSIEFGISAGTQVSPDVRFWGNDSASYMMWDASASRLLFLSGGCSSSLKTFATSGGTIAITYGTSGSTGYIPIYTTAS
jgi:hypothetical protein